MVNLFSLFRNFMYLPLEKGMTLQLSFPKRCLVLSLVGTGKVVQNIKMLQSDRQRECEVTNETKSKGTVTMLENHKQHRIISKFIVL